MSDNTTDLPASISPPDSVLRFSPGWDTRNWAHYWYSYGFNVVPITPNTKHPSVKWDPWLNALNPQKINDYWTQYPDQEVGCIVGEDTIVIDADTPQSVAAMKDIEGRFGVTSGLVIKTSKGEHHYYRLAGGTLAKSDSHSSEKHPDRLDIKTGRALAILPPSTGKSIEKIATEDKNELPEVDQLFIDAIYKHNGRETPSLTREERPQPFIRGEGNDDLLQRIGALLENIDPDSSYDDWVRVGMAIFHETSGSNEGLALYDNWSRKGGKYKDIREIERKWSSFRDDVSTPVTIGTLVMMARDVGADVETIMYNGDEGFTPSEYEVIQPIAVASEEKIHVKTPLDKFSLKGCIGDLEKQTVEQVAILGNIALLGQATVIYAKPNTGKTLIILFLIIEAIKQGRIDPANLYYINMDDNSKGLVEKASLAEEYGFTMIADGHQGFEAKAFRDAVEKMITTDTARGVIVVLDTLKRFVDTMNKGESSYFTKFVRQFSLKGGTLIALAHTNKNLGHDGKPVFSGTSDIVDDLDCAYTMHAVPGQVDTKQKVVEFSNFKIRGNVALSAAYSYTTETNISYSELLLSVQEVDEMQFIPLKHAAEVLTDGGVIVAIESCITEGINTKMELATTAAERAKVSKRSALKIIEKYTGDDPAIHRWSFVVRERGAKVFELLNRPTEPSHDPTITAP